MIDTIARGEIADRLDIADLISGYGRIPDEQRWDDARSCCTEDIVCDFGFSRAEGVDTMVRSGQHALGVFERTQHLITNVLVELAGDTATVTANLLAVHIPRVADPRTHFDVGGRYHFTVVRTPLGWRISQVKLDMLWTQGDDPRRW